MKPRLFNGTEWIEFETIAEHDAYIQSITPIQNNVRLVEQDIELGQSVILEYLRENKLLDITTEQSLGQFQKFSPVKAMLEVGALGAARDLLIGVEIDSIFTQERKEKYLTMLNGFLS